ncbi:MAG TPA: hypothetical protein VL595_04190 [Pseudonocardia sp.]|nr:hypothetical protein [Pseudonocardia sp.]
MITAVTLIGTFVVLYAGALAVGASVCAARRSRPGPGCLGGAALLELTLLVNAALGGWAMRSGAPLAEPAVHLGYLVTSVAVLPLLLAVTGFRAGPSGSGVDAAVLAVGCVAVVVVELRLAVTGTPA